MKARWIAFCAFICLALGLMACSFGGEGFGSDGSDSSSRGKVIKVVAGENFYGNIVSQIGGSHVAVTSILSDPNVDPHEYESSVKNAADIAKANLVVVNGLGYDDFMNSLLRISPNDGRKVIAAAKVLGISGKDANPHIWYDVEKMPQLADEIATELTAVDPANAQVFKNNVVKFNQSLGSITSIIKTIHTKYNGTKISYTERVPGYLVQATGLQLDIPASFPQSIEDGNDPSPADTAAFDKAITSKSVKALLYNAQVTDRQTDQLTSLAESYQVSVVPVTETMPPHAKNYQFWQQAQTQALFKALGG